MKRPPLDNLFAFMAFPAMAVAIALIVIWYLDRPIAPAGETEHIPVATVRIEPTVAEPEQSEEISMCIYDPAIPLSADLQAVLFEACAENDVPVALALGVIEVESCFMADADNGQCYGLMQLNRDYFPDKLSPEDNLRAGIEYLGRLLGQYGDPVAALTAYNAGYDTGRRAYANAVLAAAEWWGAGCT